MEAPGRPVLRRGAVAPRDRDRARRCCAGWWRCARRASRRALTTTGLHDGACRYETDILGEPYTVETIVLRARRRRVRSRRTWSGCPAARADPPGGPARARVLRLLLPHRVRRSGGSTRGYDFYALDLRKYGRSLRPHQTPDYVDDLREYFDELDEALGADHRAGRARPRRAQRPLDRRADRRRCGPTSRRAGRSSGWCSTRPGSTCTGRVLAAASAPGWSSRSAPASRAARSRAASAGLYGRSLHRDHDGRVGLRPGLEAAGVLAGVRRMAARGPPRSRRGCTPGSTSAARCSCSPRRARRRPDGDGRRRAHATTSCSTSSRSAAGRPRSARHVTYVAIDGRPARRGAVAARAARPGVRRARPLAGPPRVDGSRASTGSDAERAIMAGVSHRHVRSRDHVATSPPSGYGSRRPRTAPPGVARPGSCSTGSSPGSSTAILLADRPRHRDGHHGAVSAPAAGRLRRPTELSTPCVLAATSPRDRRGLLRLMESSRGQTLGKMVMKLADRRARRRQPDARAGAAAQHLHGLDLLAIIPASARCWRPLAPGRA